MKTKHQDPIIFDAIIDTPKGSRVKYKYDSSQARFRVSKLLPVGAAFPYNFGFFSGTTGEDGDPLDVLVLSEEAFLPGTVIPVRLIGNLHARQKDAGSEAEERNDRLIAVAIHDSLFAEMASIESLSQALRHQIAHFFVSYNQALGREFRPLGFQPAEKAVQLLEEARAQEKKGEVPKVASLGRRGA